LFAVVITKYVFMPPVASASSRRASEVPIFHYRADFFINCWHMSPDESAGMWKLYAGIDAGIAIKSIYSRLQHAFNESRERSFSA
jgi:hypothetical protein